MSCDPVVQVHFRILSFSRNVAVVFHVPKVPKGLSQVLGQQLGGRPFWGESEELTAWVTCLFSYR